MRVVINLKTLHGHYTLLMITRNIEKNIDRRIENPQHRYQIA